MLTTLRTDNMKALDFRRQQRLLSISFMYAAYVLLGADTLTCASHIYWLKCSMPYLLINTALHFHI